MNAFLIPIDPQERRLMSYDKLMRLLCDHLMGQVKVPLNIYPVLMALFILFSGVINFNELCAVFSAVHAFLSV